MKELLGTKVLDKDGKTMYKISIKEKIEEPTYTYDDISEYAWHYKDSVDSEIEKIYIEDKLEDRFNISLDEFKEKCEDMWKYNERTCDDYDDGEIYEPFEEDEDDEEYYY